MPYALDTSGTVHGVPGAPAGQGTYHPVDLDWSDLSPFVQGYVAALFETDGAAFDAVGHERIGWHPDDNAGFSEIAPDALARIIKDCRTFEASPAVGAVVMAQLWNVERQTMAGRALWFSHNGEGGGFCDGSWPEPHARALGEAATEAAIAVDFALGEDGLIHIA